MKIWKAKCIVLIHRRQIVSKFSISICSYNQAFLFAKAHNLAVNAPGRSGRKSRRKGVITGRALLTTTVSYYSIRNSLFLEWVRKIFDNGIQCAMIAVQSPQLNIWCFFWHDKTRLTNYTLTSATWLAARNNGKRIIQITCTKIHDPWVQSVQNYYNISWCNIDSFQRDLSLLLSFSKK